jgi:hypothetical protein
MSIYDIKSLSLFHDRTNQHAHYRQQVPAAVLCLQLHRGKHLCLFHA